MSVSEDVVNRGTAASRICWQQLEVIYKFCVSTVLPDSTNLKEKLGVPKSLFGRSDETYEIVYIVFQELIHIRRACKSCTQIRLLSTA